ncbi:hypothetical protein Catovirus_1_817 [Catovirus CTV1]|uniref:Uncharacterized protein n=1 Tax=Catovirus CTV1 TaxID=1977631 RepID=A0A1V0SAM7_9VIRU|nr:hypothetical protein Catovirus_1_817 [Catovirus CTV1]
MKSKPINQFNLCYNGPIFDLFGKFVKNSDIVKGIITFTNLRFDADVFEIMIHQLINKENF